MPRWKLNAKHYINAEQYGEPTQWVREETNRETGRTFRKTFKVPLFLDPSDPSCCNRNTGLCVVAHRGSEQPGDITFEGPPTPDMEPLDAEAQAISDKESPKWIHPIDSLPASGEYGSALLQMLERQFDEAVRRGGGLPSGASSLAKADDDRIARLEKMVEQLAQQNAALLAEKTGEAPVVDDEPLPELDLEPMPPHKAQAAVGRRV